MKSKYISMLVALMLLVGFFYFKYRFSLYTIPQAGMVPSILPSGKVLSDSKAFTSSADVNYGDVVVFWDKTKKYIYIWRVIAKPGDRVELKNGIPIINGTEAVQSAIDCPEEVDRQRYKCSKEQLAESSHSIALDTQESQPVSLEMSETTVPSNEFFMLGDCRNCAADSRSHGTVSFDQFIGRASQ